MLIDAERCIGCGACLLHCPLEAAVLPVRHGDRVVFGINQDACCECGNCARNAACPSGALQPSPGVDTFPRQVRRAFSDPSPVHRSTGVPGRGTDECKNNDITGRVGPGQVGLLIELGRPGTGVRLDRVQEVLRACHAAGFSQGGCNPVATLLDHGPRPTLRPGLGEQVVLSCILEFVVPVPALQSLLLAARSAARAQGCTYAASVVALADTAADPRIQVALHSAELALGPAAKINFGLGRPPQAGSRT